MTLLEAAVAVTVLGIIAASVLPVINGATDVYAATRDAREASGIAGYAAERISRIVREAPAGVSVGTVGFSTTSSSEMTTTAGDGVRFDGTTLEINVNGSWRRLATGVDTFELSYFGADGTSDASGSPTTIRSVRYRIVVGGFELRGVAAPRIWIVE